jgi:predicted nucleic acid-binding protein
MIFVDSNIPMYLTGADHPHKHDAMRIVGTALMSKEKLVTSAEVLQEINHRFAAIGRRDAIQPTFDVLLGVVDEVLSVSIDDVTDAKDLLLRYSGLDSRDALHVATMKRAGVGRILSFDRGFDAVSGVERIS